LMSVPSVYSSTDANAPVLVSTSQASWLAVLKACLVTGYLGKAGAGWSVAFEDDVSGTIVFQQPGGNQRFLRLGPGGYNVYGGYSDNRFLPARSYQYMTDINTGTGMFPDSSQDNVWSFAVSYNAGNTSNLVWRLFATDKFFAIYIYGNNAWQGNATPPKTFYFFGDFSSTVAGDAGNTILNGYLSGASYGGYYALSDAAHDIFPWAWAIPPGQPNSGLYVATPFYQLASTTTIVNLMPQNLSMTGAYAGGGVNYFPDFCSNGLYLSAMNIVEFWNGYSSIRGTLPGIFVSTFSPPHPDGTIIAGTGDLSGHSYMAVNNPAYSNCPQVYIQLDEWND
jgi:hypothetical protein